MDRLRAGDRVQHRDRSLATSAWPSPAAASSSWRRSRRAALTSPQRADGVLAGCRTGRRVASASVAVRNSPSAANGSEGIDAPEEPGHGSPSAVGRVSRNRRSRNRLAFSHDVSEANEQQWHAAPCRKSSGSLGVRIAHTGSDEHRAARRSAESTSPCSRAGSDERDEPTEGAFAVGCGGADQQPGGGLALRSSRSIRRCAR